MVGLTLHYSHRNSHLYTDDVSAHQPYQAQWPPLSHWNMSTADRPRHYDQLSGNATVEEDKNPQYRLPYPLMAQ